MNLSPPLVVGTTLPGESFSVSPDTSYNFFHPILGTHLETQESQEQIQFPREDNSSGKLIRLFVRR